MRRVSVALCVFLGLGASLAVPAVFWIFNHYAFVALPPDYSPLALRHQVESALASEKLGAIVATDCNEFPCVFVIDHPILAHEQASYDSKLQNTLIALTRKSQFLQNWSDESALTFTVTTQIVSSKLVRRSVVSLLPMRIYHGELRKRVRYRSQLMLNYGL